ncbi:MAG TPA: biotin/lipoyl-containing protein, partial [Solirubrobacteraceae bacterium]
MATSTTAEQTIDVVTPAAGESVTEGTILEWHVKVGGEIKVDDTIVEISTDKVDVELPSPATGKVSEILAQEGDTVTVGQVIARIVVGGASGGAPQNGAPASNGAPDESTTGDGAPGDGAGAAGDGASGDGAQGGLPDGVKISPVAARAAAVEGVDLANVSGSGPAGQIRKADVLSAGQGAGARQATGAPANDMPTATAEGKAGA